MEQTFVKQVIKKEESSVYKRGEMYYRIISAVNSLHLTEREIQLMSFTAIHKNMSYSVTREEFCKEFNTSPPTINNMISKLKRMGLLIKDAHGKIKVHPVLSKIDFSKEYKLEINIYGQTS